MKTIPLRLSLKVDRPLVFMLRILSAVQLLAWLFAGAILFSAPLRIVMPWNEDSRERRMRISMRER